MKLNPNDVSTLTALFEAVRAQPENAGSFFRDVAHSAYRRDNLDLGLTLLDSAERMESLPVDKRVDEARFLIDRLRIT